MKKILLTALIASFAFSFSLFFNSSYESIFDNKSISFIPIQKGEDLTESDKTANPELYYKYHTEIRTRDGEDKPSYPPNYKINELLKAKGVESTRELSPQYIKSSLVWDERGPGNVSGRTRGIVVDPDDSELDTWYVGSVGGGVWKTTDAGESWIHLTESLTNLATSTIVMAPSNPDIIYVGTGEGFNNVDQIDGDGIWKSTDRGLTWEQLESTTNGDFQNVMRIVVDPNNENIILAATNPGFNGGGSSSKIFKSTDGGESWYSVFDGNNLSVEQIVADPNDFNVLYATVNTFGVVKSVNAGETWENKNSGLSGGRFEMAVSPVNTNRLFISAEGGSVGSIFYYSNDAAESWTRIDPPNNWLGGQGWYDNTIAGNPFDENICYVGGINLWEIVITGTSSIDLNIITDGYGQFGGSSKGVHVDQHNIVCVPISERNQTFRMIVGNDGGVSYSDDAGATFKHTLNGYNTTQFYGFDKNNGTNEYIGGMQDNSTFKSPSGGSVDPDPLSNWSFKWGGDGYEAAWHYTNSDRIIVSSQYNNIGRSDDRGASFYTIGQSIDRGSSRAPFFTKVAESNQDPDLIFVMGSSGLWRSTDFGTTWKVVRTPGSLSGTSTFSQVKISLADPLIIWAGSGISAQSGLNVSRNGGLNYVETNGYDAATMGRITGLATHPSDPKIAYALFSFANTPKILKTNDYGQTWEDISGFGANNANSSNGFPDVAVFSLAVMPYDENILWAGTEIGMFESTNNGTDWHLLDSNLPSVAIYDIKIVNDQVVVATHGRGIWSITLPELEGYEPLEVGPVPVLNGVTIIQNGLSLDVEIPDNYEKIEVYIDDELIETFTDVPISTIDLDVSFITPETKKYVIYAIAYKDNREMMTEMMDVQLYTFSDPIPSFSTDFETDEGLFYSETFYIKREFGFTNSSAHSKHPYNNSTNEFFVLKKPIVVDAENSYISFDEVVIVEPGFGNAAYGDPNFKDYVIVEGSKDGENWIPIADGYDSRKSDVWVAAYDAGSGLYRDMFEHTEFDLLDAFEPGDVILIRFRLYADGANDGWGWTFDNLEIQERLTNVDESSMVPSKFELSQNYPNPFNPTTTIEFSLPQSAKVNIEVYNALGESVSTLIDGNMNAGVHRINWNASSLSSGIYFYRITAKSNEKTFIDSRKMVLLK